MTERARISGVCHSNQNSLRMEEKMKPAQMMAHLFSALDNGRQANRDWPGILVCGGIFPWQEMCYVLPLVCDETELRRRCISDDPLDLLAKHLRPFLAADRGDFQRLQLSPAYREHSPSALYNSSLSPGNMHTTGASRCSSIHMSSVVHFCSKGYPYFSTPSDHTSNTH